VLGEVIIHVELAACTVGIEHAHLDHGLLPESLFRFGAIPRWDVELIPTEGQGIASCPDPERGEP
jgi:hypothetical protein